MDTNELLRQRALRLVNLGCSQKILAAKMGMVPATFSRWLNQKDGISPARTSALDGFNAYVEELRAALADSGAPIVKPEVPESHTTAVRPTRATGTTDGRAIAPSRGPDQTPPVPLAPDSAIRQVATELVPVVRAREAQLARAARKPPAGAHRDAPRDRAGGRRSRR